MSLLEKIENRTAVVGIVGLGYVGLPLAVAFAEAGFCVKGIDVANLPSLELLRVAFAAVSGVAVSVHPR